MERLASDLRRTGAAFHLGRVSIVALGHGIHDSYTAFLAPMLIVFKQTLGLNNAQVGLLAVFMTVADLLEPFIGSVADRRGARYFVALAPLVTGVIMSVIGLSSSYLTVAVLLVVVGLSSASLHAVGPVMAGNASGKRLGLGMSLWGVGGEAGRFAGPLAIGLMLKNGNLPNVPWLMIGGIVATIALLVSLRDKPGSSAAAPAAAPKVVLRDVVRGHGKQLVPIVVAVIMHVMMSTALQTYLPLLLNEEGESIWFASVALSVLQAAGVAGALLGGTLSDRLGRRRVLFGAFVPTSLLMLIFGRGTTVGSDFHYWCYLG